MSTDRTSSSTTALPRASPIALVGLAAELVQLRPDVLVVVGLLVMDAIKDATGKTPSSY